MMAYAMNIVSKVLVGGFLFYKWKQQKKQKKLMGYEYTPSEF